MTLLDDLAIGLFVPNTGTITQVRNPSGANGTTSGWEEVNTLDLTASSTSGGPLDHGVAGPKFIGATTVSGGPVGLAQTLPIRCVFNEYVSVKFDVPYVDGFYRIGFQFLTDTGTPYGAAVMNATYRTASASTITVTQQATVGSAIAAVQVLFVHYSTNTGTAATAGQELLFRNVKVGIGSTAVISANIVDRGVWHDDIKGAHSSLKITRRPMQLATVAASLKSDQLPVGLDDDVKPGNSYRVLIGANQLAEFELTDRAPVESTRPIPLTHVEGADAGRALALRTESRVTDVTFGTPPLAPLWEAFSDSDIPWKINGSSATGPGLEGEAVQNDNMTAIDQIVLARDLNAPSYAWIDRLGVGNVSDLAHLSAVPSAVLDESTYSQLVTGYDMDSCFNIVTISRITGSELTAGVPEMTLTDYASVETWDERPVKVRTTDTSSAYVAQAQKFLDLNSDPTFQVLSVRIPLHRLNDSTLALLDLYDLVTVQNTAKGIDEDLRVTSIEHEITPRKWILTLGFSVEGIAAIPQVLPEPPS